MGVVVPYGFFLPWLLDQGLDFPLFITELLSTRAGAFFGADVIVAAVALFGFVGAEGRHAGVKGFWVPVLGTICVGSSLGLPLFLDLRELARAGG